MVDPNGVGTQLLHELNIALALLSVNQGVVCCGLMLAAIFLCELSKSRKCQNLTWRQLISNAYNQPQKISQKVQFDQQNVEKNIPLTKNCFPSGVKSLFPTEEIGPMASTVVATASAAIAAGQESFIFQCLPGDRQEVDKILVAKFRNNQCRQDTGQIPVFEISLQREYSKQKNNLFLVVGVLWCCLG